MNQSLKNQNVSHFLLISHDCVAFDLVKNRSQTGAEELIKQQRGSSVQSREDTRGEIWYNLRQQLLFRYRTITRNDLHEEK